MLRHHVMMKEERPLTRCMSTASERRANLYAEGKKPTLHYYWVCILEPTKQFYTILHENNREISTSLKIITLNGYLFGTDF